MKATYVGTDRVKLDENNGGIITYYFFPEYEEKIYKSIGKYKFLYYFSNGKRIAQRKLAGTSYNDLDYYHKDHLGSTILMSDASVNLGTNLGVLSN